MWRCRRSSPPISPCRRRRRASAEVGARVAAARARQTERFAAVNATAAGNGHGAVIEAGLAGKIIRTNAEADGELLEQVAAPDAEGRKLLTEAAERFKLSARGYHRVLRVARTLGRPGRRGVRAPATCGGGAELPADPAQGVGELAPRKI